jgi:hypothetical protein
MDAPETLAYVRAAARAVNLPLDDATAQRVADHLQRTAGMVQLLDQAGLAPEHELAEIYKPAPFPVAAGTERSS